MNKYTIGELPQAKIDFRAIFNTGLGSLLEDRAMIAAFGFLIIDIVAFDKFLQKEHPEILTDSLSVNQAVKRFYGEAGVDIINKLMLT